MTHPRVGLLDHNLNIVSSSNALPVRNITVDEYGVLAPLLADNIFRGALIVIDAEHHEIHCGDSYEKSFVFDLTNGQVKDIVIVVPNEGVVSSTNEGSQQDVRQYHLKGTVSTELESTIQFFEGVTTSTLGTSTTPFNRNRNSLRTDFLGIYPNAVVTSTGVELVVDKVGSGRSSGGEATRADEFILKDNTVYCLRITNDTTNNNYVSVNINYYVHPGV